MTRTWSLARSGLSLVPTLKKVAKAKKPATDVATADDKGGFFSWLFGGGIKQRSQVDAKDLLVELAPA